jgi:hypothetical protein
MARIKMAFQLNRISYYINEETIVTFQIKIINQIRSMAGFPSLRALVEFH